MGIIVGPNNRVLRERLNEITRDADEGELKEQIEQVRLLSLQHPHSITLVEENIPGSPIFTCYGYSFDLVGVYVDSVIRRYPGRDFAQALAASFLQEVSSEAVQEGDHVLYFGQQLEHAGKVQGGGIESKWGQGHLWHHGVYEVAQRYGDTIRFFRKISREDAIAAFREFYQYGELIT